MEKIEMDKEKTPKQEIPPFKSEFLDTACRISTSSGAGQIFYLDTVYEEIEPSGYPTVHMKTKGQMYQLQNFSIVANVPTRSEYDLKSYGIDPGDQTVQVLYNDAKAGAEKRLRQIYTKLGDMSADELCRDSFWKRLLYGVLRIQPMKFIKSGNDLISVLMLYSNLSSSRSRRGGSQWAIVSRRQRVILEESPAFILAERNGIQGNPHYEYVGNLPNGLKIFVDYTNHWDETKIVMGRNTVSNEPGVYRCESDIKLDDMVTYDSMTTKYRLIERSATISIGENAHKNYISVNVKFGKRPLWRRILGI